VHLVLTGYLHVSRNSIPSFVLTISSLTVAISIITLVLYKRHIFLELSLKVTLFLLRVIKRITDFAEGRHTLIFP
jgi:hypothetical protein